MAVKKRLTEEEMALAAILMDDSGLDMMEFMYHAETADDGCYRARPYQWLWWTSVPKSRHKMSACGRDVGKSESIINKSCAFPYAHPGHDLFITAPTSDHLDPLTRAIEARILSIRILRELLKVRAGKTGISRVPAFQAEFRNGSKIVTRLPKQDGKGVKGQHAKRVIVDEGQDFPEPAWDEVFPTMRSELPDHRFEIYGVTAGLAGKFDEFSTDPDTIYELWRKITPEKLTWGPDERKAAIKKYGGETSINYGRNIFGVSSGIHSNYFVTARLMACVRVEESAWATEYNRDVYQKIEIDFERIQGSGRSAVDELNLPASHLESQYLSYSAGWDVGLTNDASELLVFGAYKRAGHETPGHRLLTRISMHGIASPEQVKVVLWLIRFYGDRLLRIALDGTGLGLPIWQTFDAIPIVRDIVKGYGYSQKLVVGWEDRPLQPRETLKDVEIRKKTPDHGLDIMRKFVDSGRLELPMDTGVLSSWQGVGEDHVLNAGLMFGVAIGQREIDQKMLALKTQEPILPRIG